MAHETESCDNLKTFLDDKLYTDDEIRKFEFIFGKTYISTGGQQTTEIFAKQLDLNENCKILDVGCGVGGSAFHIARTYGSSVYGVDLSSHMISIALEYQAQMEENVRKLVNFEVSDVTKQDFAANSFDVIYSRDCILHIAEKEDLFAKFFEWLKPGGKLLITDYCRGTKDEYSKDFLSYVETRRYHLLSIYEYGKMLEKTGFTNVVAEDYTNEFVGTLHDEKKRLYERKEEFLQQFTEADFKDFVNGWNAKLGRCDAGEQIWGLFKANKALE